LETFGERERDEKKISKYRNLFLGFLGVFNPGIWILLDKAFNRNWEKQAQNGQFWGKNDLFGVKNDCFEQKITSFKLKIRVFNQK